MSIFSRSHLDGSAAFLSIFGWRKRSQVLFEGDSAGILPGRAFQAFCRFYTGGFIWITWEWPVDWHPAPMDRFIADTDVAISLAAAFVERTM